MGDHPARRFDAEFRATPGTLSITSTYIAWNPKVSGAMDRQQQNMNRVINMLASKAGKPKVSLKLLFRDDVPAGGLLFTFTSAAREDDRKAVQDVLIPFVSANRGITGPVAGPSTPMTPSAGPSTATAAIVSGVAGANGLPSPAMSGAGTPADGTPSAMAKGKRKAEDGGAGTPMTEAAKAARKAENRLKMKVLSKNSTLKMLHRELVLGGQITEKEFWEGREALLQAEALAQSLKPGRPSRLLDDRFDLDPSRSKTASAAGGTGVGVKQKESGPMVLNITKDLTREIFEEFPVVQDAYARFVPGISEAEFWTRYFTSRLWEQHRASVRKTTNDEVMKKQDDIFDQYLEEPDWNAAPRRNVEQSVGRFLDLAATEEDHGDAEVVRDVTMQAGRERSSLPLIRRFNEHSNKLLRRGQDPGKSGLSSGYTAEEIDIYNEIDLEDLHGPAESRTIALDVQEPDVVAERRAGAGPRGIIPGKSSAHLVELAAQQSSQIQNWFPDFSKVSLPNPVTPSDREKGLTPTQVADAERFAAQRDEVVAAMLVVKDLHVASNAENAIRTPFPHEIMEQIRSCHNAATEFLRQYWSAVLPLPANALAAGTSAASEAARAAKAEKMAGYLRLTEGKVGAVIATAQIAGVDTGRVRAALAPTVGAVKVALEREARRTAGGGVNGSAR